MLFYPDSSAWVKRYFNEAGSHHINGLFDRKQLFACSPLGLVEVSSTMARKHKAGQVSLEELKLKQVALRRDWRRFFCQEFTAEVIQLAINITIDHSLRGADNIRLASVLVLKNNLAIEAKDFTFVTSDQELKSAALHVQAWWC